MEKNLDKFGSKPILNDQFGFQVKLGPQGPNLGRVVSGWALWVQTRSELGWVGRVYLAALLNRSNGTFSTGQKMSWKTDFQYLK